MTILRSVLFSIFALSCVTHLGAMENEQLILDLPEYYTNLMPQLLNHPPIYYKNEEQDNKIIRILNNNFHSFNKKQPNNCSIKELINTYKKIFISMRTNWFYLVDYRLHPKEYYDEWALFYKNNGALELEDQLIYALAQKFNFEPTSVCIRVFKDARGLYIRRDLLDKFIRLFDWKSDGGI